MRVNRITRVHDSGLVGRASTGRMTCRPAGLCLVTALVRKSFRFVEDNRSRRLFPLLALCSAVWALVALCGGCVITQQSMMAGGLGTQGNQGLIKPVIPEDSPDLASQNGTSDVPRQSDTLDGSGAAASPSAQASSGSPQAVPQAGAPAPSSAVSPSPSAGVDPGPERPAGTSMTPRPYQPPPELTARSSRADGPRDHAPMVRAPEVPARSGVNPHEPPKPAPESQETHRAKGKAGGAAKPGEKSDETEWEDQKVRHAAMGLRDAHGPAQKMKLCYAVKDDEWWVTFYEDAGSHYELKQYVWDRDLERLEPFLVLKRVGKERFDQHLSMGEPDRACEVIDLSPPRHAGKDGSSPSF